MNDKVSVGTPHHEGDVITFYNGGQVIIDWISDRQIGFRKYYPGSDEPVLVRMDHAVFEAAIRIPYGAEEGLLS